ncbi:BQ2448_5773 [Microbotryum intermedium]|uniref:BQ2448_5773 protein n=1 Tax=Microbotryum intermedium TaxID=269621 RepID=A0A238F266_9BASI|nr:BQ2448_5773 [Microbotryum intermedium]
MSSPSSSSNETQHASLGQRIMSAITGHHTHAKTKSPAEIASQKHRTKAEHDRLEVQADAEIHAREVQKARQGPSSFQAPQVVGRRPELEELVEQARHPQQQQQSTTPNTHHQGHPDLMGGTHIPETSLHQRHHETQHTALRPNDPNDKTAMDGAVRNETSAGDDYAI